jgi:hypothetical protein
MFGLDYSDGRPSHAAMKAAGAKFVVRYIGSSNHTSSRNAKFITPSEYRALKADGFEVVLVFEQGAQRAEGGRAAGLADAELTKAELAWLGLPANYPAYYAVDEDTTVGPLIAAYFGAINEVRGVAQTGGYGGYKVIKALLDQKLIRLAWQTLAWSYNSARGQTDWDPRAQLRQYAINKTVGGESVDFNESYQSDYGQAPVGGPTPKPKEKSMPFAGTLSPGEKITISFPMGSVKAYGLAYDFPKQAKLRVAFHYKEGHGEVFDNLMVGGPASATDSWPGKNSKPFAHPEKGDWVSIYYYPNADPAAGKVGWDLGLV